MCNAAVDAIDAGPAAGVLEIRTGTQPASAQDAATGTLLATVTLPDPAYGAAATGAAALNDPGSVAGAAAGTAGWCRMRSSDDVHRIDGSVTATGGGGDLELSTTTISVGVTVDITGGGTFTVPAG
jgi:hypothetical protein